MTNLSDLHFLVQEPSSYGNLVNVIIRETPEGFLKCGDCNEVWCAHIEQGIRENLDAVTLWERTDDSIVDPDDTIIVQIPLLPTKNLYAAVSLQTCSIESTRKLLLHDIDMDSLPSPGFVHIGEGRMAIRIQIMEWFRGVVDFDKLRCRSTSHGFKQEMLWQNDLADGKFKTMFPQYWNIFLNGECLNCSNGDLNLDDFIPGSESEKFSDRNRR